MGTRGLLGCRIDGELKGTYNHYDSYPDGLGAEVVEFCRRLAADQATRTKFVTNFRALEWVNDTDFPTPEQIKKINESGFKESAMFSELEALQADGINQGTKKDWYWAIRSLQGIYGWFAITDGFPYMIEYSDFINESLFCEYAYVLDLNNLTLEFWEGFQRYYLPDDEAAIRKDEHDDVFTDERGAFYYGPCKKVGEKSIFDLADDNWMDFFKED